jgi:hypothetical protein
MAAAQYHCGHFQVQLFELGAYCNQQWATARRDLTRPIR